MPMIWSSQLYLRMQVTAMKWIENDHLAVHTGEDKIMKLWDTRKLGVAQTFPIKQYFQTCCDTSSDGTYVVTGSTGGNGHGCEVMIWDRRSLKQVFEMRGHTERVTGCRFMEGQNSRLCSVSEDCTLKIWDSTTRECVTTQSISGAKELTSVATWTNGRIAVGTFDYGIHEFCYDQSNSLKHVAVF